MTQIDDLTAEIEKLVARLVRLETQVREVEDGKVEVRNKFDKDHNFTGCDEVTKSQPSAAVAYWKEIRETERRLDERRADLRTLQEHNTSEAMRVEVHFDGPKEDDA